MSRPLSTTGVLETPDPAAPVTAPPAGPSRFAVARTRIALVAGITGRGARRIPVTLAALALLLVAGGLTTTLWRPLPAETGTLLAHSYGTPALQDGHWWTFLTGAFLEPRPEHYLLLAVVLVVGLGAFERRAGHLRAAVALIGTQLIGTVGAAALLLPVADSSWPWAVAAAQQVDLGLTAGALGVAGAATAFLTPEWRRRVRVAAAAFLIVLLLKSGLLWDLSHLLAFTAGVLAGPALIGRRLERPTAGRPVALQVRAFVALVLTAVALANLIETMYPGIGGLFGAGVPTHAPLHGMALMIGELVVALLVADGLRRGRAAAWWLATAGTAIILVNSLVNLRGPVRIPDVLSAGAVLLLLLVYRNAWKWRTPNGFAKRWIVRGAAAVVTFGVVWMTMLFLLRAHLSPAPDMLDSLRETMSRFTFGSGPLRPTNGATRALLGAAEIAWALTLIGLLVPWLYADRGPDARPREVIGALIRQYGGGSLGWMRTWPAFTTWTSRDGQTAISYCVVGTVAIAIGDPVGREADFPAAVRDFRQFCAYAGWTPCWFAATPALVRAAEGLRSTQIGEDTVMDLRGLEFKGKSWQDIRTARNHAKRDGVRMEMGRLTEFPDELRSQIERISGEWVSQKALPEMGFTLGTVSHALDPEIRTHVALDADGVVHGITTWLPVHRDGEVVGWTLDLMRRSPGGFRPVMDFLIAESAMAFQAEGYESVSLSVAPLARRTQITGRRTVLDRTLDTMSTLLEPTYGFRSLMSFKAKFHPEFRPVYLVYAGPMDLAMISLAIGRAYLPNLDTRQAAMLLRGLRHKQPQHA
ncbi:DUF2156 domain-containing protein [Nakamurella sp. YIM 132087]|uniref:DUF2156 domain-containing protein n=1 Tax=Nakamurella alba TaxID=2665158 RepID=A0A7K1FPY8_9ACTN|nr:DUF2156 domain-containing protein [Nakamurella alba]MTD16207.1 DUF2156 domain-containing protein [Nakamurella alba]